ncbi:MAG: sugar transferase, partial [Sulfurovum sp.]|nr:sugar transferase [Sulfurovaceae bacterium]
LKRLIDFVGVAFLTLFSLPVMIYSIYKIKKESPDGDILFTQKRIGINGEEFICYKFRSMIPNAEKGKPTFASKNDIRTFPWGETMRKRRFDELPQMWNVIKGDMHLIGPRPERKYWVEQFEKEIPYYNERHIVRPGITGWAQIKYPYGENREDAKHKLMYDLYYIKRWTVAFEFLVVWKTSFVVFEQTGV